jgi:hypothetical protein
MTTDICFQGIPVWATSINNSTHIATIWSSASGPPSGSYSTADLDFTKSLGSIGDKSTAQYDDFLTNITSQSSAGDAGRVYYAVSYASSPSFSTVCATGSWTIPSGNSAYQYKCWVIIDTSTTTRYHGFKVKVTEVINSDTITVDIYRVSDTTPQKTNVSVSLSSNCLSSSYDANTVSAVRDAVGALYFSSSFISSNSLELPKLPPGLGDGPLWPSSKPHR